MGKSKLSFKEINRLAIPAIIAGIAEPIISLTDIAMIGNIPKHSVEALAAAGIVGSFLSAIIWVVAQTKTAISSIVSQHLGQNRIHAVKTLIPQVLIFNFILSVFIYISTTFLSEFIFSLYNAEGLVLDYAVSYYKIRSIGYPITLVTFAIFGVFRGLQNTLWAMLCSLVGALLNVLLDFILIYGVEGLIPAMHLEGAAYASLISQFIMLVMALYFFFTKTPFKLTLRKTLNPQLKTMFLMTSNLFVRAIALNTALYLANSYATGYGDAFMATQSILMNIWLFFSFFIDGYATAGNALSGKFLGAKDYKNLWKLSIVICKYSVTISLLLIVICSAFYYTTATIFTDDVEVLALFTSVFWIVLSMQPINAIAFTFDGVFKGLGETVFLRNVIIGATFLSFIPILFVGDFLNLKLYAIWGAFFSWMCFRAFVPLWWFKKKYINTISKY